MKKPAALYIKFLAHNAKRQLSNVLDPVEQRVIETFAYSWHEKQQIPVVDAMHNVPGLSPSTVHRRLKTLRAKGMLTLVPDAVDTRIKYVHPGPELLKHLDHVGVFMHAIAMGSDDAASR